MPDSVLPSAQTTTAANVLHTTGHIDPAVPITELRMADGRVLRVPTPFLHNAELLSANAATEDFAQPAPQDGRIAVVEERLHVSKQTVPTAAVRLHKSVETYTTALDETLAVRTYDIERIVLNRPVDAAPGVRTEGDTTVYPVVEEQAIVTKQLVLKEEIRVTRRDTERHDQQPITLRREHVEIEREPLR